MPPRWYESAIEQLEDDLAEDRISPAEFEKAIRELNDELRQEEEDAADAARRDVLGW